MNAIPITLTLYYPTMAQVEAYAAFTAMMSIALCGVILIASLGFSRRTIGRFKEPYRLAFSIYMVSVNPLGALMMILILKRQDEIRVLAYLIAPIIGLWLYAAI